LRRYPSKEVLGYLFGVSNSTTSRILARLLPLLEAASKDTMLVETPELAVIIDTLEQRVQPPHDRLSADRFYSGKKRQHTLKSQVVVDEETGAVYNVSDSQPGVTADLTVVRES